MSKVKGVRHKFLIFNHANHAFESIKRKNWPRILTHWVSRSCCRVIAESFMPTMTSAFLREVFSASWWLRERLAPQVMWWSSFALRDYGVMYPPSLCEATAWCGNWFALKIEFNKGSGCQFLQFFRGNWAQAAFSFKNHGMGSRRTLAFKGRGNPWQS